MAFARGGPAAVLLPDGRVLVAGGSDTKRPLASAELYNPATRKFALTGPMSVARWGPTATLLPDGLVLIAGGFDGSNAVASAELYSPATGTFAPTGSMATARLGQTATLLRDGRVLTVGGLSSYLLGTATASAELFDPATSTFSPTGSMSAARFVHSATLLADGRVLIAGGRESGGGGDLMSAELYEPTSGTFSSSGPMTTARESENKTVVLLRSGAVLIAGGYVQGGAAAAHALTSAELCQ